MPLIVVAVGAAAYSNCFSAPFIFDDLDILSERRFRSLWPPWAVMSGSTRPLTDLSFAVNYWIGSTNPAGYHALNLIIHLAAGLVLFGLARRTLLTARLHDRYASNAASLALAIALIWVVHPLQTESVTYIKQRAESLMGLCYLFSLFCLVRGAVSRHPLRWQALTIAACAIGMLSKPIMVTAPVTLLLYDRVFLAASWRDIWRARGWMYAGLGSTWLLTVFVMSGSHESAATIGFRMHGLTTWEYARTQPGIIVHYLSLALWPSPLVLDYAWPIAGTPQAIVWPTVVIVSLGTLTVWALRSHPACGFIGAAFFIVLAPTSSIVPIADLAFEHRMYVPLAAFIAIVAIGADAMLRRTVAPPRRRAFGIAALIAVVTVMALLTLRRNHDYGTEVRMWTDVVEKRPENSRAHNNLGEALYRIGMIEQAVPHFVRALELAPYYADAHNNLGTALDKQGHHDTAAEHYREAIRLNPDYAEAHNNLGLASFKSGRYDESVAHYREALRLKPDYAEAHSNLGVALVKQGHGDAGIEQYREAMRFQPDYAEPYNNLGNVLASRGQYRDAAAQFELALRIKPESAEVHNNFGLALAGDGKHDAAIERYLAALRLKPDLAAAHHNMGNSLLAQGKLDRAVEEYRAALRLNPNSFQSRQNLALALERMKE